MFCTYAEFLGIGYIRDDQAWHISVLFNDLKEAKQVWDAQFKRLDGKNITISFVECKKDYKFMVYSTPLKKSPAINFSLYRSLEISRNYQYFKKGFDGKVRLDFAIMPNLIILGEFKIITNVKFIKEEEIEPNSPEWIAREAQNKAKNSDMKSGSK